MISAANDTPTTSGGSSNDWLVREVGNFLSEAQVWQESDTRAIAALISRAKNLTLYDHLKLMLRGMVKLDVDSSKLAIKYRTRNDNQLSRAGKRLLTLDNQQAILGNGSDVKVALYISDVGQFLGRAGALFQVSTDAS